MKKKIEKLLAGSLAGVSYAAPIGLGAWYALRQKKGSAPKQPTQDKKKAKPAPLESLSLDTPGDAPLDRLARIAAQEERERGQEDLRSAEPPDSAQPHAPESSSVEGLLEYQSLASRRLAGWTVPQPQKLPVPTYSPAIMAFGIVVFAMGLATTWYVCVVGSLVFAVAAWRWTGELQGESSGD